MQHFIMKAVEATDRRAASKFGIGRDRPTSTLLDDLKPVDEALGNG